MYAKCVVTALLFLAATIATSVAADSDAAKRALAEDLMVYICVPELVQRSQCHAMKKLGIEAPTNGLNGLDAMTLSTNDLSIVARVRKELSWESVREEFLGLFLAAFSEKELAEIVAFYRSPAGKAMIQRQDALKSAAMRIVFARTDRAISPPDPEDSPTNEPKPEARSGGVAAPKPENK